HIHLTYDELATLDHALQEYSEDLEHRAEPLDPQGEWDQTLLTAAHEGAALRQKLDRSGYSATNDPIEQLHAAYTAVIEADQRVSELVDQRSQAVVKALEAGYTQTELASKLGVSQSRIAHMKTRPRRKTSRSSGK